MLKLKLLDQGLEELEIYTSLFIG